MWADLRAALSFLTILPLGYAEGRKPGWSFACYPLVGLLIGSLLALVKQVSPFETQVTAFLVLAVWVIITGGLHLDGLGDSCDGLLATVNPARRLAIMKDPRAGSWAVLGLILLLLGKWTLIPTLPPALLILPPVTGRWVMVIAAYAFPYARPSGLGAYFRDGLGPWQLAIASILAVSAVLLTARAFIPLLIALSIGLLTLWLVGQWAAWRLGGGLTGDVYGALCELSELFCLLGLSLWARG